MTQTVGVTITGDLLFENDETFTVTLSNAVYGSISDAAAVATIRNDDSAPQLSINDQTGMENSGALTFTVSLDTVSGLPVSVVYSTTNGTAIAGEDYQGVTNTLSIPAGQSQITFTVSLLDDAVAESTETFSVLLSNPSGATLADAAGTGTILDDEPSPKLSIADVNVGESGGSAVFTVTLSVPNAEDVGASYATSNGSAIAGTDYTAASSVLTITAGLTVTTISVPILPDTLDEDDETFTVTLSAPMGATILDAVAIGTIVDDDPAPTLAINDANLGEADGSAVFTVTLSVVSGRTVSVNYATVDVSATASTDYTPTSGTLTFAAGETTKNVTVSVTDDAVVEATESFSVTLSAPVNATLVDASGIATVTDNDSAQLTIADASVAEGDSDATNAVFTLTLSAAVDQLMTVNYVTAAGSATAADDYVEASGVVTFAALAGPTQPLTVTVNGDFLVEADETFTVTLSGLNTGGRNVSLADAVAVGTIRNDDSAVVTLRQGAAQLEGDSGTGTRIVTATLDQPVQGGFTVTYATADGSAIAPADYVSNSGQLTFSGVQSETQTISLQIVGETLAEANESFQVSLGQFSGTTLTNSLSLAGSPQTIVIRNDDGADLSVADVTVNEDAGHAAVTVTASAPSAVDAVCICPRRR
ncbi:MAG: Calx-beta domain-containing protein [Caldilineaceae bacterium]